MTINLPVIGYFQAQLEKFEDSFQHFNDAEMEEIIKRGKEYYCCSGYDESGYYQAGFIQGSWEEVSKCDLEFAMVARDIATYERRYGHDFVKSIRSTHLP